MKRLDNFNPKDTAIIEQKDKIDGLNDIQVDETATISLVNNNNDEVNYKSSSSKKQLAVFSEIYYKQGWKAYIDNAEAPIVKANYVLRALVVPAGSHSIRFEFKPVIVNTAQKASAAASITLWGLLVGIGFTSFKKWKSKTN